MLTTEADKFLLGAAALQDMDSTDDKSGVASNKAVKDVNLEALLEAKMLDEVGVGQQLACSTLLPCTCQVEGGPGGWGGGVGGGVMDQGSPIEHSCGSAGASSTNRWDK